MTAFSAPLPASMPAMAASTSSSGVTSFLATRAASAVASSPARSSCMARSLQDRDRLERDLFVLGLDPEPDRLAAVLLLQVGLVQPELGGEALEGHALDVLAERLARRDVLVVEAPVVLRLGLAGQGDDLGVVRHARARGQRLLLEQHLRGLGVGLLELAGLGPAEEPRQHDVQAV